jgi:DNA polymerase I-like protein with 3'-5' exonuclease and polymerase domains/uracil-DNA glycosylase
MNMSRVSLPMLRGNADGARCPECPLCNTFGEPTKPVFGEGPEAPKWIIVGEGPGYNEVRQGRPFCGASGQVVDKMLARIGQQRDELWVTNATLCVEGTTNVRLADGSLRRIDQLVKDRYSGAVSSVDVDGTIVNRRVTGWFRNRRGRREMRDVSFLGAQLAGSRGYTHAVVTEDHPILTSEGWQRASDVHGGVIATGDRAPNGRALQIALGTLLGDGTLQRGSLIVKHAVDQIEYAKLKLQALSGFGVTEMHQPPRNGAQAQFGFRTKAGAWGHAIREKFYPSGHKRIPKDILDTADLLLFAIWYMDDGSMSHRLNRRPHAEICGVGFPEEDLLLASAALRMRGFDNKVRRGRIHFSTEVSAAFSRAIASFIPPSMDYKLCPEDRGQFDPSIYAPVPAAPFWDRAESVLTAPRRKGEDALVYCLEVEDTHNFITPGAVVHNCLPPSSSEQAFRDRAAACCKPRLQAELARFPGVPVLTLGAVAARALIPQETLDAIDPPDAPKAVRKAQKLRQQPVLKTAAARRQAITKETQRRLKKMLAWRRTQLITEIKVRHRKRPDEAWIAREIARDQGRMQLKAREDAIKAVDLKIKERALQKVIRDAQKKNKPKAKNKKIKITDIVGTLFDVDVDGSGVRPLIPAIHPAALLRGGGAAIGGSHSPDMGYVNLCWDAAKIKNLAAGKNIRLDLNISYEVENQERAIDLFLAVYRSALAEKAVSIDLETYVDNPEKHHALMAYVAKIKVIGLSTNDMTVSIAWELLPAWAISLLQLLLGTARLIFHNALYDATVLRAHGFIVPGENVDDTMLMHHAAFPGCSHNLQTVTAQFYGTKPWKSQYRNQEETSDKLAVYNAQDTGSTHALRAPLTLWLKNAKTERVYDLDRKMADVASHMHLAGMPVDREINSELLTTFSKSVVDSRRAVEDIARDPKLRESVWHHLSCQQARKQRKLDPPDYEARYQIRLSAMQNDPDWKWKIGSGKHIAALLLAMGVGLYQTTDGGDYSTQKDILEGLVDVPIVRDILSFRENDKLLSTFCVAPGTRVITADLRWVPIEELRNGDNIIGFDENGRGKHVKYRRSLVEGIQHLILSCCKITTDRGSVISSLDHLWLARNAIGSGHVRHWKKASDLQPGNVIAGFCEPWPNEDRTWEAGFVAGFLEGEGCVSRDSLCLSQNLGPALDHVEAILKAKGFDIRRSIKSNGLGVNAYITGGVSGTLRALGQLRSPRLLAKAHNLWDGKSIGSLGNHPYTVLKVEPIGMHPVVAMKTSTKTFIAEGMLTHNCWPIFDRHDSVGNILNHGFADENSRIHPIWNVHRISGRWASQWPVVSNVPKDKWKKLAGDLLLLLTGTTLPEKGQFKAHDMVLRLNKDHTPDKWSISRLVRPNLRRQIRVTRRGRKFVGFDFAQIESRVIALISGDPFLCAIFAEGRDPHIETARIIWPHFDTLDPDTRKQLRENVKNIGYGFMYMAALDKLYETMLKAGNVIKKADLARALAMLSIAMSGITAWQQASIRTAMTPPYEIHDFVLGRFRSWPLGQAEGPEAVNYGVQTAAAAIMNTGMANMAPRLQAYKEAWPIAQIHDAAIFEVWENDVTKFCADVKTSFEQRYERDGRSIPFPIDLKVGDSWDQV